MSSRKLSNSEILHNRIRKMFVGKARIELNLDQADEVAKLLTSSIAQLPSTSAPQLRSMFPDLFCPFCAALHPLSSCTHPGVTEFRLDPVAWMQAHIPAGLQQTLAKVEVKSKPTSKPSSSSAPGQSKTRCEWRDSTEDVQCTLLAGHAGPHRPEYEKAVNLPPRV